MVAWTFCCLTLVAPKPLPSAYPKELNTIGDHIRKRRLDLKLFQEDVAKIIGVREFTITGWEKNRVSPRLHYIPKIIEFLGYNPCDTGVKTFDEKIVAYRRVLGLNQKELARALGIDPTTLGRWERNEG